PSKEGDPAPKPEAKGDGVLRGKVQFEDMSPVTLAHVFLISPFSSPHAYVDALLHPEGDMNAAVTQTEHYAKTVADGSYEMTGIADGQYTLETRTKFFSPVQRRVVIENGIADFDGVVTVHNGGSLAGSVAGFVTPELQEISSSGLTVELSLVESGDFVVPVLSRVEMAEKLTDSFYVDRLPPGTWNVAIKYGQLTVASKEGVVIEKGRETRLDLEMNKQAPGGFWGGGFAPPNTGLNGGEMDEETRLRTLGTLKDQLASILEGLESSFQDKDVNGDGFIDSMDAPDSSTDILDDSKLRRFDKDGDGRVSKDEFVDRPQINMLKSRIENLENK
ncbi:MAG: EF-hand domain-containing protein, partial [Planctomycetes bacterium]|nr:EF-hand domain-containing protein [Planctomycetota bacterium]